MQPAHLVAIWLKRFKGGPMDRVESATLEAGLGLAGNANRGGRRQVTLLDSAAWREVLLDLETDLPPSARRANLLVSGVVLTGATGRILRIGPARLRIGGETRPCNLMEETWPGLEAALRRDWRGGAFAEVIAGGVIAAGDGIAWEDSP